MQIYPNTQGHVLYNINNGFLIAYKRHTSRFVISSSYLYLFQTINFHIIEVIRWNKVYRVNLRTS